ncbi:MAG: DUF2628 domain-containing protein [Pseudomonadota bacterium]
MAVFTVWEHDKFGERRREKTIIVRDGFSWRALVFGPLWLIAHGMVVVLLGYLVVMAGAAFGALSLGEQAVAPIMLVMAVWFGFEARSLHRWALARRGFRLMAMIEAKTRLDAERRYFDEAMRPVAPPSPVSVPPHPVPGVFPTAFR